MFCPWYGVCAVVHVWHVFCATLYPLFHTACGYNSAIVFPFPTCMVRRYFYPQILYAVTHCFSDSSWSILHHLRPIATFGKGVSTPPQPPSINRARWSGRALYCRLSSVPSGVWGKAPAAKALFCILSMTITNVAYLFFMVSPRNCSPCPPIDSVITLTTVG